MRTGQEIGSMSAKEAVEFIKSKDAPNATMLEENE